VIIKFREPFLIIICPHVGMRPVRLDPSISQWQMIVNHSAATGLMDPFHIHQRMGGMCPLQAIESKVKLRHNRLSILLASAPASLAGWTADPWSWT